MTSELTSQNLLEDIVCLAKGLKTLGYVEEAKALEDKFFIFKEAETHLYRALDQDAQDWLDLAHPTMETFIDQENGKVETLDEAQRKILDAVNLAPVNKFASVNEEIINTVAHILRQAQVPEEESFLEKKLNQDRAQIKPLLVDIQNSVSKLLLPTKISIPAEKLLQKSALQDAYFARFDLEDIFKKYEYVIRLLNSTLVFDVKDLQNKIFNLLQPGPIGIIIALAKILEVDVSSYFTGSQPSEIKRENLQREKNNDGKYTADWINHPYIKDNEKSIWQLVAGNSGRPVIVADKIKSIALATQLISPIYKLYSEIINEKNIKNFIDHQTSIINTLNNYIQRTANICNDVSINIDTARSTEGLREEISNKGLFSLAGMLEKLAANVPVYVDIINMFFAKEPVSSETISEHVSTATSKYNELISLFKKGIFSESAIITEQKAFPIAVRAQEALFELIAETKDPAKRAEYESHQEATNKLVTILQKREIAGQSFEGVKSDIADLYPGVETQEDLVQQVSQYFKSIENELRLETERKKTSSSNLMSKTAQLKNTPGRVAPKAAPPGKAVPANPGAGLNTVKQVQKKLIELGDALASLGNPKYANAVTKLKAVTKDPNNPDGVWGGKTDEALTVASSIAKANLEIILPSKNDPKLLVTKLQDVINFVKSKGGQEIDKIPQILTVDTPPNTDGNISLMSSDLNDISSFFNFLINSKIIKPFRANATEYERGELAVKYGDIRLLNWFLRRANLRVRESDSSVSNQEKIKANYFYDKIQEIGRVASTFIHQLKPKDSETAIALSSLYNAQPVSKIQSRRQLSQTTQQPSGPEAASAWSQFNRPGLDGNNNQFNPGSVQNNEPFNYPENPFNSMGQLDLRHPYFSGINSNRVLDINEFRNSDPAVLMPAFIKNAPTDIMTLQYQIANSQFNQGQINRQPFNDGNFYILDRNGRPVKPLSQDPNFQKFITAQQMPLPRFLNFLSKLKGAIGIAYDQWAANAGTRNISTNEIARTGKIANNWIEAINIQENKTISKMK